ncbi:Rieske 2Fe-2S domain-containing protein [Maritimibacter dapengensis]|uniref:Rieske 2Fe-2S domain-containing protein n=1 Tax=Maritimibacter dapengensis TaxID=2836868 RepID=A0ABS6SYH6_9RHOB|nr:Rieske 2Fe-2S domain-containing protein [Maritimibacter dapengensis]MBV7377583.1 Rieske 2Fe-2S domain-containing protein [Maritimibacter dapengensis]
MPDQTDTQGTWVRIAASADLDIPRPVRPVTLEGHRLVLFRDDEGELGLIGRNCPHRGADLCYGRLEDNGLRCPFHGWHFDRTGQCVEQPAEPEGSKMFEQIKVPMVPVREENGEIFALVGADLAQTGQKEDAV